MQYLIALLSSRHQRQHFIIVMVRSFSALTVCFKLARPLSPQLFEVTDTTRHEISRLSSCEFAPFTVAMHLSHLR